MYVIYAMSFFTCNLLIIFTVAIEKKIPSAKDTLTHFKEKLLAKLPLESDRFLAN